MKPKTLKALGAPPIPTPHNLAQRLRRIRTEVGLIGAAIDDALAHIERDQPREQSEQRNA